MLQLDIVLDVVAELGDAVFGEADRSSTIAVRYFCHRAEHWCVLCVDFGAVWSGPTRRPVRDFEHI